MSGELFNKAGKRLYLTGAERLSLLSTAEEEEREIRTFVAVMVYTGCRISEALQLSGESVDTAAGLIVFESLKKRKRGVFRAIPVPPDVLSMLELVHGLRNRKIRLSDPLWSFGRTTAWKKVKALMKRAGIKGPHATPKGLRHGFGVGAVQSGIPLNLLQRWMGHAQLSTTAIYADAVGEEERNIASKMWKISA